MGKQQTFDLRRRDHLREKCGVFGVFGKAFEAARLVHPGLWALQHRGQESTGIAASDSKTIRVHRGLGLVAHVFDEDSLRYLKGYLAIGHNRYSTSGGSWDKHAQPVVEKVGRKIILTLAHNGNLPSTKKLEEFLKKQKIKTSGLNDSEMMAKAIAYFVTGGVTLEEAIKKSYPYFTGVFCLLVMDKQKIVALRDAFGIRPLCLGKLNNGYVVASETCALDIIGAKFLRYIKPGEMIVLDKKGLHSFPLQKGKEMLDVFEFVYFARPDSYLMGKSVDLVRQNFGRQLALENGLIKADIVIPVPDSAIPQALAFSKISGIPFYLGLIKNRYIHRTFIMPEQHTRNNLVQLKLNPMRHILKGKRVIVIDDSIVRGTTSKELINMIRGAGASKVHLLISSPPVKYPDFYGIDTPKQRELIASTKTVKEIEKEIGVDSLHYLSYAGLIKAIGVSEDKLCTSCFTGNYPVDLGEKALEVRKVD